MKVLILLTILALAAAKSSKKEVVEESNQVVDPKTNWQQFLPQPILQQFMPQQKGQQYVPEQKYQPFMPVQNVPLQKYQQYVPEQKFQQYYPQQYWPQEENSQIAQFITNYFYQAHQNKFTSIQFASYLIKQGFPEFVVVFLTEQYEAFQNQPYVQTPSQTYQFYFEKGVPLEYHQWFAQHAFAFQPFQEEQYFEQFPTKMYSPKTSQYPVNYKPEEQQFPWSWKMSSPKTVQYQSGEEQNQYVPYSPKYQYDAQYFPKTQGFEQYGSQYPSTYQYGPYQQVPYGFNAGFNYNQMYKQPYQSETYKQAFPYNWNKQVVA